MKGNNHSCAVFHRRLGPHLKKWTSQDKHLIWVLFALIRSVRGFWSKKSESGIVPYLPLTTRCILISQEAKGIWNCPLVYWLLNCLTHPMESVRPLTKILPKKGSLVFTARPIVLSMHIIWGSSEIGNDVSVNRGCLGNHTHDHIVVKKAGVGLFQYLKSRHER